MALLLNLYLGHLLGDFVFQPGWLVMAKRRGVAGLLIHVSIIGLCTAIILYADLASLWNIVLLAMAAHLAIEVITIRMRAIQRLSGLSVFLIDQAMHITSLVILIWIATPVKPIDEIATFGRSVDATVVALACSAIGVSFLGSIVIFEAANAFGPDSWNRDILPWSLPRILGMVERTTALLLGVMVSPALLVVPFIPRVLLALREPPDERARNMLVATVGLFISIMGWGLVLITSIVTHGS